MDSKAIRMIVIFGVMATLALTGMMMMTLDQVADTLTPQIASDISHEFAGALADEPPANVKLTMTRDGKGADARRLYKLRLRPNAAVAADAAALSRLVYHACEMCAVEVSDARSEVSIRCIAELPDGTLKEANFVKDKTGGPTGAELIRAVAAAPKETEPPAAPR